MSWTHIASERFSLQTQSTELDSLLNILWNLARWSRIQLTLCTYKKPPCVLDTLAIQNYFFLGPSKLRFNRSYFASPVLLILLRPVINRNPYAQSLHGQSHVTTTDMKKSSGRANIFTPALKRAIKKAFDSCTSWKPTGRPTLCMHSSFEKPFPTSTRTLMGFRP